MQNKKSTGFYLTPEAKRLIRLLSEKKGVSQSAIIELVIREQAKKEKID